jgi:hypothetical protein
VEILTWCDPQYFVFANALIRSIRYHGNTNLIHLNLMDFTNQQHDQVRALFKNDSMINFIQTRYDESDRVYFVNDKEEFYRNYRPRLFLELLKKSESGKLCTFGANGIVFTKLDYIEALLDDNDFVFLEREKNNVFTNSPKTVRCIDDVQKLIVENNIDLDELLDTTTGKIVLLGTHAMRKNDIVESVLNRWISLIENTGSMNKKFSDMNYFVKSYITEQLENDIIIKKETGLNVPRSENPFCDTSLIEGNKIWFAKGPQKFINKTYLDAVKFFVNFDYEL